jgi:HD-like signal output (HDOD) protein
MLAVPHRSRPVAPPWPAGLARIAEELDLARRQGPLRDIRIPPCPDLLVQLQAALQDDEPDLCRIAQLAAADVAMSAALIRQANSAAHAIGSPIHHVGTAMTRLGLDATVRTMTQFALQHAIRVDHPALRDFWQQSARQSQILVFISGQLPALSADLAFGYGLFGHVGLPVLMQSVRGYAGTLLEGRARIDRSFIETENANHRTDHAVVGALVARTWRLAPPLMAAIRLHHELGSLGSAQIEPEVSTLVAAGLVADHLAARAVAEAPGPEWAAHGESALAWLGLTATDLDDWDAALAASMSQKSPA